MTLMAPALTPLQQEYKRRDLLLLERMGVERKIEDCERHIAELEAALVGVPQADVDDGDVTPPEEVPAHVAELKEMLAEGGGRRR